MRLTPRKTLLGLLGCVLVQLTVYFTVLAPGRGRAPGLSQMAALPRQHPHGHGACDDMNCPAVKEGMINVHLIPHSHTDVGWLKTAEQYYTGDNPEVKSREFLFMDGKQCVRCTLNTTIDELLKNPARRFIFMEMAFLARFWNESSASRRQEIKNLIQKRQLEVVLGGWVMSDAAVTYYNDIIDQHTLGFDFLQQKLGPCAQSRVAWHVDQFGHSREHAAIFAKMGYDALFVGRVDYQDHETRKKTKNFEFVWQTSPNADDDSGNLFTQVTFDGYYAPHGFVLDGVPDLFLGSRAAESVREFEQIVRKRANHFRTNHLLMPMGSDFGYREAGDWFRNMDTLIKLVNEKQMNRKKKVIETERQINLIYSTPSCYVKNVHDSRLQWATKSDDFHPYAISPGAYWTGYFTSRSGQKLLVKRAGATLQACKQLGILARLEHAFNRTDVLRKAVAVMQHHDAITGTEKQHVSNEYNRMLSEGIDQCQSVISDAYNQLLRAKGEKPYEFTFCPKLNISECAVTETEEKVVVLAYNSRSRAMNTWLRLPVTHASVTVRDNHGNVVPSQLAPIPEGVVRGVPERNSESDTDVVFPVTLPPMGYAYFLLTGSQSGQKPMRSLPGKADIVMQNKYLRVTFDGVTGRMKEMRNVASQRTVKLSQDMAYYRGVQGGFRSSGAYVFVPEKELPHRVGDKDPVSIRFYDGPLVQEVHQQFSSWVSQVVRLYKDARHLELQWSVGPIPVGDNVGKEVVSFFVSDIKSAGTFYTDSNGREMLERRLNKRETWNLTLVDAISGNYYPVTGRIYIQDKARDVQLTVVPDRSQGGSSLYDGTMELMVHRRLLFDDGLGVGEPLNERGVDGDGIKYTGKHLLYLDTLFNSALLSREGALDVHFAPTLTFLPLPPGDESITSKLPQNSFLTKSLPKNVQVLTLDYSSDNHSSVYLLRLEHYYEKRVDMMRMAATVELKGLFAPFQVKEVEEVSLGGNFSPSSHRRLKWTTNNKHVNTPLIVSSDYKEEMREPFSVTLKPMEIRTFRIYVSKPSPSSFSFFS